MISTYEDIQNIFKAIDKELDSPITVFVIGGAALMHHGMGKGYTKDIDVVLNTEDDLNTLRIALYKLGFQTRRKPLTHNKLDIWEMLEKDDYRFDIFVKTVCKGFFLSDHMIRRAEIALTLEQLTVLIGSKEDIVVFKSLSPERMNDVEDSIEIIKRGIEWKTILSELKHQANTYKYPKNSELLWYFLERVDDLESRGVLVPIKKEVAQIHDSLIK